MSKEYADLVKRRVAQLEVKPAVVKQSPETGLGPIMDMVKRSQSLETPLVLPIPSAPIAATPVNIADYQEHSTAPMTGWGDLEDVLEKAA